MLENDEVAGSHYPFLFSSRRRGLGFYWMVGWMDGRDGKGFCQLCVWIDRCWLVMRTDFHCCVSCNVGRSGGCCIVWRWCWQGVTRGVGDGCRGDRFNFWCMGPRKMGSQHVISSRGASNDFLGFADIDSGWKAKNEDWVVGETFAAVIFIATSWSNKYGHGQLCWKQKPKKLVFMPK